MLKSGVNDYNDRFWLHLKEFECRENTRTW
jgi:hypothetical protein